MIGALMNPHTALYTEIFLLEYITGRGTRFACAYIFLLFIPCYIFIVTFAGRPGGCPRPRRVRYIHTRTTQRNASESSTSFCLSPSTSS